MTEPLPGDNSRSSLYETLGVSPDADYDSLRRAYRKLAFLFHPDRNSGNRSKMQELNEAWSVLSDPALRESYDQKLKQKSAKSKTSTADSSDYRLSRKMSWFAGLRLQALRHGREASTSATLALAIRHGIQRSIYQELAKPITDNFGLETERRVKLARQAGATPLDLGLATALVSLREYSQQFIRRSQENSFDPPIVNTAQLLDRIWDNLAHGISRELEIELGGNPRTLRTLTGRRV